MKKKIITIMMAATLAITTLVGCGGKETGTVTTDGSTSMEKVIGSLGEAFQSETGNTFTYNPTGSGSGIQALRQADLFSGVGHQPFALLLGDLVIFQSKFDIGSHGHGGIDRIVLEDHCDATLAGGNFGNVCSVDQNGARGLRTDTSDHTQQSGLTATGGTDQDGKGTVGDGQVQILNDHRLIKALRNIFKFY